MPGQASLRPAGGGGPAGDSANPWSLCPPRTLSCRVAPCPVHALCCSREGHSCLLAPPRTLLSPPVPSEPCRPPPPRPRPTGLSAPPTFLAPRPAGRQHPHLTGGRSPPPSRGSLPAAPFLLCPRPSPARVPGDGSGFQRLPHAEGPLSGPHVELGTRRPPPSQSDGAVFPPSATPSPLPLCPSLPSPSPKAEVVRGTHVVRGTQGISLPGSLLRASPSTPPLPPPPGALHPGPTPFTPQVWLALLPTQVLGPESPQPSPISRLVSPTTPFPPRRQLLQTHRTGLVTLSSRAFGGFLRSQQEDPRTDLPSAPLPCSLSSRRTGHQRGPSSLPSALL